MLIYRDIFVDILWYEFEEVYHWKAWQGSTKIHDSIKQRGFSTEESAIEHAKREVDFLLDTEE